MQNTLRNWNNETRSNDALSQLQETSFFSNQDWCPLCQGIVFVKKYYNIYWTIQYILIYETLWFGFVPPTSKKYTLYLINHCTYNINNTNNNQCNLWQPMPGRLCDPFSSSTPLAPPSSTEWWNGPPSQTEWNNRENQHLQAERGHKPWMSIKKARDVVGYNVKNIFVNIIRIIIISYILYILDKLGHSLVFVRILLHKLLLPVKTRIMQKSQTPLARGIPCSNHWESRFLNAASRSSKTPWPLCVWTTVDPSRHTVVKHWRTWLKILSNSNKV